MSIHETSVAPLTPEQQAVLEIGSLLNDYKFSLAGHGTAESNPSSFFENGIRVSSGHGLPETAIPIDQSNVQTIDDWPHKKWSPTPSIVLLAVPFAEPDRGVYFSDIIDRTFMETSDGRSSVRSYPSELIVGFYNPKSKEIAMNPDFDVDKDTHGILISEISKRAQEYRKQRNIQASRRLEPIATPVNHRPTTNQESADPGQAPLIW